MSKKEPSKPQELKDFEKKFNENTKYSGFGMGTTMHMPCGFCAEPDFLVYKIMESDEVLRKGAVCKHCGRGLKAIFHVDRPGEKRFELVQTCGPDAPRYLASIRRIDCGTCNDTHKMTITNQSGDSLEVMCTDCPRPCADCQAKPQGAFCARTPCPCNCHKEKRAGGS